MIGNKIDEFLNNIEDGIASGGFSASRVFSLMRRKIKYLEKEKETAISERENCIKIIRIALDEINKK